MNGVLTTAPARRQRPRGLPAPKSSPLPGWLQGIVLLLFISNGFQHPYDAVGNKLTVQDGNGHVENRDRYIFDGKV